jgi:hypothetical protein
MGSPQAAAIVQVDTHNKLYTMNGKFSTNTYETTLAAKRTRLVLFISIYYRLPRLESQLSSARRS